MSDLAATQQKPVKMCAQFVKVTFLQKHGFGKKQPDEISWTKLPSRQRSGAISVPQRNGDAIKCGQRCNRPCWMRRLFSPACFSVSCMCWNKASRFISFLFEEPLGSPGVAVFVKSWVVKAGLPWRKVRLDLGTALPSGLCASPDLGYSLWPVPPCVWEGNPRPQREATMVGGTQLRRKR